jgi:hypothetical protein
MKGVNAMSGSSLNASPGWPRGAILLSVAGLVAAHLLGLLPLPAGHVLHQVPDGAEQLCVVADPMLSEVSGLACSRNVPGSFWMHNDSGDTARLFLVAPDGKTQAIFSVAGETPRDWEDMCSFEFNGRNWLLIGDVGDNAHVRGESGPGCRLLLIEEPDCKLPKQIERPIEDTLAVDAVLRFRYPDGPVNCESVAVDTERNEILVLSKTDPLNCQLYSLPLQFKSNGPGEVLRRVAAPGVAYATAMDVSSDNRRLVIVTMLNGALVERQESESWADAMARPATALELPSRVQGETVCFTRDNASVLMNSERTNQPLWKLKLPASTVVERHNDPPPPTSNR